MTQRSAAANVRYMLKRPPRNLDDWNLERAREDVLHMRHQRWRSNSTHVLKLIRTIALAWLLVRHGADLTNAISSAIARPA